MVGRVNGRINRHFKFCCVASVHALYVREKIHKDFLFAKNLPDKTTNDEIFKAFERFFSRPGLNLNRIVGVCTDGAGAMTGQHSGVATRIKQASNNEAKVTHCIINRSCPCCKNNVPRTASGIERISKSHQFNFPPML